MRSLRSMALVVGICFAFGAEGCVSTRDTGPDTDATNKAMLRVVHASPDAPAVDVWAGGEPLVTNVVYGDASEWMAVDPDSYDIEIKASPSKAEDPAVYTVTGLELEKGDKVSAVAAGLLGSSEDAKKLRLLPIREDFAPSGSGSAIVRVIHASPDAPTVGIDLHDNDPAAPEHSNIDRFTDTEAAGFPLTSGEKLQIGIVAGGARVTAFTTPELPEGAEILVIATGLTAEAASDADGFSLLAVGPEGSLGFIRQNPFVQALHASPDAPMVDLYAGEALLVSAIEFGNISGVLQVPPGTHNIDFRAAGTDPKSPPAATAKLDAPEAGKRYLSVATGFLASTGLDGLQLASFTHGFTPEPTDEARIRLVHGSPDAPRIDAGILNVEKVVNPVLVKNLAFGTASSEEGFNSGTGTIPVGVTPTGENSNVAASFHVTTVAGLRAFAVAAGSLAGKGQTFRLLVVDTAMAPWTVATIHPQPPAP